MIAHSLGFLIVVLVGYVKIAEKINILKIDVKYPQNDQISEFSSDNVYISLNISKGFKVINLQISQYI